MIYDETSGIRDLKQHKIWQYLIAWVIVQKRARKLEWSFPYDTDPSPRMEERFPDLCYYVKFALAIYGKLLVNVLMNKSVTSLFKTISEAEIIS